MIRYILLFLLLPTTLTTPAHAQSPIPSDPRQGINFDLGIASYAYRKKDLDEVIRSAQRLNVKKLALKSYHLPLESSDAEIEQVKSRIATAGLNLYAGAVIYMENEEEVINAFTYAEKAGMEMIVGVPNPELMDLVEQKVKEHDIQMAIHNHGSRDILYPDAGSIYPMIKDRDERIGLCLDVGHTLRLNLDPADEIRKYADRLLDIQIWDASSASPDGRAVLAGYGVLPFADILKALIDINYTGAVTVEYWDDAEYPQYGTAHTIGYIEGMLQLLAPVNEKAPNTLSPEEKQSGWRLLFDGQSTKHWRGINQQEFPASGWEVKNGALCIAAQDGAESGNGGDIVTRESFGNFELRWEWKMLTRGGNSGLKYFVQEGLSDNSKYGFGLEYQILDDANHPWMQEGKMKPGDFHTVGSLYEIFPATNKKLKPLGEWNQSRIVSKNNRVEHWLNGVKVLEYERGGEEFREKVSESKFKDIPGFGEAAEGHILLQDHGSRVCFRNIKIKEL